MLAGGYGEHNYHMRIRVERQRHYAHVADRIFQIHTQRPLAGLVVAGIGVDAAALLPHLHTYLHDLVLGVVRLNPSGSRRPRFAKRPSRCARSESAPGSAPTPRRYVKAPARAGR